MPYASDSPEPPSAQCLDWQPRRLLMISNLFPDQSQPWRGLDNAMVLEAMRQLRPEVEIRVLNVRPSHRFWCSSIAGLRPRLEDEKLQVRYSWAPYLPRLGGLNDRFYALGIRRALRLLPSGFHADALLLPWLFPDACAALSLPALSRARSVAVAQGSDVHQYLNWPMRRRAILALCRRAKVITRSEELRQRLVAAGADGGGVTTLHNGVERRVFFAGDARAARLAIGLPAAVPLMLFVGNFLPVKGLELLLQAMALLPAQGSAAPHLILIGSGPLEPALRDQAKALGLEQRLHWVGRRDSSQVAEYMRAADVLVMSSHHEGLPNVVLESLACGLPVVSTAVGGIHEVITSELGACRLVPGRKASDYADAVAAVLNTRSQFGAGLPLALVDDWTTCARRYWKLFETAR